MTRHDLPSHHDIQKALTALTASTGKPPTALALAGRLGLANTTFRRHFPDIAAQLKRQRGVTPASPEVTQFDQLKLDNNTLREDRRDLRDHLDLAMANIQRLTLENHQLRRQLEAATRVTRIKPGHQKN